jgi:hypothetical protein
MLANFYFSLLQVDTKSAEGLLSLIEKYGIVMVLASSFLIIMFYVSVRYVRNLEKVFSSFLEHQKAEIEERVKLVSTLEKIADSMKEVTKVQERVSNDLRILEIGMKSSFEQMKNQINNK